MDALLHASFQAGVLAVVIFALEAVAGRWLTPHARLALWSLVPLRLVVVFPLADPLGAERPDWWTWQDAAPAVTAADAPAEVQPSAEVEAFLAGSTGTPVSLPMPAQREPAAPRLKEEETTTAASTETAGRPAITRIATARASTEEVGPQAAAETNTTPIPWLLIAWLGGVLFMMARAIGAELRLRRHLKQHTTTQNTLLLAQVQACAEQLGMRRSIEVIEMEGLPSPAAYGWRRARLLLPEGIDHQLDEEELRFVILHELAHLRHHDSLQNLGMTLLGALHWFNPLVVYAHHRIREERELLRDREAIAALPHVPARQCAATLVKLLPRQHVTHAPTSLSALVPHHRTTRRRIAMIIQSWRPTRLQLIPGIACVMVLAWASLTHASAVASPGPEEPATSAEQRNDDPHQVRVTRQTPEPEWRAAMLARMQTEVQWTSSIEASTLVDILETHLDCHVRTDYYLMDYFEEICAMPIKMPASKTLDLLSEVYPMGWRVEENGLYLFSDEEYESPLDLRFYDVAPLVHDNEENGHSLVDVIHSLTQINDAWDREDASIQFWNGQLLVKQSEEIHGRIEGILNMLLSRKSTPLLEVPAAHKAALEQQVKITDESDAFAEISQLLTEAGIPLIIEPDMIGVDWEIDADGPLHVALARFSRDWDVPIVYQEGAMYISSRPPLRTACYDVSDLCEPSERSIAEFLQYDEEVDRATAIEELSWSKAEELIELMYSLVNPNAWEEYDGNSVVVWDGLLLITQTEAQHRGIVEFLSTARRAVSR